MRHTTEDQPRGIRWTLFDMLEDLDFADDLALLSYTEQHMQEKTCCLSKFGQRVGLQISKRKTEVMTLNVNAPAPVLLDDQALPGTETLAYLDSVVRQEGGTKEDIQSRLSKGRNAFWSLNAVWRSSQYSVKTKLKLYRCCISSTLLYGSECWWITEHDLAKLSSFHMTSLRKIQHIFWPRTTSTHDRLAWCQQDDMETIITRKRWRWIGHVLRKDADFITKVAIHWTPEGKWKHGCPKTTWQRTVEVEMKNMNHSWGTIQRLASDRQGRKSFMAALYANWCDG